MITSSCYWEINALIWSRGIQMLWLCFGFQQEVEVHSWVVSDLKDEIVADDWDGVDWG